MKNIFKVVSFLAIVCSFCDLNCQSSLPPSPKPGYVPVVLVNNCNPNSGGVSSSDFYFLSHGLDDSGIPCYLVPDSNGICEYVYPNASGSPSSASSERSIPFTNLPLASVPNTIAPTGSDARLIYLPINSGSRAYISLGNPMYLPTVFNPAPQRQVLDIGDAAPQNINDPNFYTLYQDFEMGLVNYSGSQNTTATLATTFFVNLSYVDYFCLPMQMQTYSYPSYTKNNVQPVSGTIESKTRDDIIHTLSTGLSGSWNSLLLSFYSNPYIAGTPSGYTRVLAAKNSIAQATGAQYVDYAKTPTPFPADYVSNITTGPQSGLSFLGALANFCAAPSNAIYLQIFPAGIPLATVYKMTASGGNTLQFTCYQSTDASLANLAPAPSLNTSLSLWINSTSQTTPTLTELTTELLLSGSLWPFSPAIGVEYTNELSKAVSALFSIGQLPLDLSTSPNVGNSQTNPFVVSSYQGSSLQGGFYQFEPSGSPTNTYFVGPTASGFGTSNGPWYNLYDKVMHTQLILPDTSIAPYTKNPSYGLAYAYDYDDLLNLAGLVSAPVQDQYAQTFTDQSDPTQNSPFIVVSVSGVTAADLSNLSISSDTFMGSLYVVGGYNGVEAVMTYYDQNNTEQNLNFATLASSNPPTQSIEVNQNSSQPVTLTFTYGGTSYVYKVNLTRQIVLPSNPENSYSSVDQAFIEGVSFLDPTKSTNPPTNPRPGLPFLQIQLNTSPPAWAG